MLSETEMHKILKPIISPFQNIFIWAYTIYKYFFLETNVDGLKKILCKFFANTP